MSTAAAAAVMSPAHALPLESFNLSILPKTTHNIAWSPDNELAIGCDDCVLVYVPDFSLRPPATAASAANGFATAAARTRYDGPRQYDEAALRFPVAPLKSPELNRHLFAAAGPGHDFAGYTFFTGAGANVITGHGSTLNHTVALAWSPGCLGRMNRAVLAVLTAAGILTVYCQGAAADNDGAATSRCARTMRPWIAAWHVGGGFLVPAAKGREVVEKKECVAAMAWARDTSVKGVAVLAYLNSEQEVVVLLVSATHDAKAETGHPGTWKVLEVARFMAEGPHPVPTDPTDPDYVHSGSSFALSWSPWLKRGSSQTSILSYVAHNYIGFRQITIDEAGSQDGLPSIHVDRADTSGVCLHLSADAFVVWEDQIWTMPDSNVCRGVIASPTKVQAFELPFDHTSPVTEHTTDQCGTVYPAEEDLIHMQNPITGLIIHPPSNSQKTPTPAYTLVRLSATHDNPAWHQTNLIMPPSGEDDGTTTTATPGLDWATEITQIIEHQLPRALAHRQGPTGEKGRDEPSFESDDDDDDELDSDMDSDSDFGDEDEDDENGNAKAGFPGLRGVDTEDQIHLHRVRIWGLTASPGGKTSAVLVSLHSTIELERDTFAGLKCRVLFGAHHPLRDRGYGYGGGDEDGDGDGGTARDALSTEARAWEWMYGGGPPVPGFSEPAGDRDELAALRDHFLTVARRLACVFCEMPLVPWGTTSCCRNGHVFENCANTGVPIVAPNVSRTCGVCGLKCLKSEELLHMAPQLREVVEQDISAELCGGCGGKFMN